MLKIINNETVVSESGFIVKVPNIHKLEYVEGEKKVIIEIEGGMNEKEEVVWNIYITKIISWEPQFQNKKISDKKKKEILKNISDALKLLGMKHVFQEI